MTQPRPRDRPRKQSPPPPPVALPSPRYFVRACYGEHQVVDREREQEWGIVAVCPNPEDAERIARALVNGAGEIKQ